MDNKKCYDYLIVGAGLYGATCAYCLNKLNKKCLIIDKREHIGGNMFLYNIENIKVHKYGPHIFHTNNEEVWSFVNKFVKFNNYINTPMAIYKKNIYNLPFNMNTFSKIWRIKTPQDAIKKINKQKYKYKNPKNLEEQALNMVGKDIYKKLIKGYTEKQWGRKCKELSPDIIKRLPLRFMFNNNYFNAKYQGICDYNILIEKLLKHNDIILNINFKDLPENIIYKNLIYTGSIDEFFDYKYGELEYRTVRFENEVLNINNFQGNAVINYTDKKIPYTRIIEHKHFYFNDSNKTIITKEFPIEYKKGLEPFYPINNEKNNNLYKKYLNDTKKFISINKKNVYFGGRLGEYCYNDMDTTIEKALKFIKEIKNENSRKEDR